MKTSNINPEEVLEWMRKGFFVQVATGRIFWKNPPKNHPKLVGSEAGHSRPCRGKYYVVIKRNRRAFKRGWLIFLWKNKRWPHPMLDHKDGNSTNDAIKNIREANLQQNAQNHKGRAKKSPLPMGIRELPTGKYQARIAHNKISIAVGSFETKEEAVHAYQQKRQELFAAFA